MFSFILCYTMPCEVNNKMKLKELVDIKIGLSLERKKATPASMHLIEYKALTLKSFLNLTNWDELCCENFIADKKIGVQHLTKINDVIVRTRSPNYALHINDKNTGLVVSSIMAVITNIFPNVLNSKYLAYYLNSGQIQNQLTKNIQGTSIPMIKVSNLLDLDITLPSLTEQSKIVEYLTVANYEIDLLHQLICEKDKLKQEVFETLITRHAKVTAIQGKTQ
ncbi:MAG: hypothetical protein QG673_166 [Pseudomonadota bacterium]|nr:hypothetical protein [Pseudomonadota bacterium]